MAISIIDPSSTTLLGMGPGTVVTHRGSVMYIVQCQNVSNEVYLRNTTECSYDLPVTFRGEDWFRDPRSFILKKETTPVSCKTSFSIHHLRQNYYIAQKPHFEILPSNVTLLTPHLESDEIFSKENFKTLGTPFGIALDNLAESILLGISRATQMGSWLAAVSTTTAGHKDIDAGLRRNANLVLKAMKNGLDQFQQAVIEKTIEVISWTILILIIIVCLMYGIGVIKSCIVNGIRSPVTAAIAWALPLMIIDFLRYFARIFGLLNNPNQHQLTPLSVRWQQIVFESAYQS